MEPYHRIVIEVEKFHPSLHQEVQTSNGRYILIVLKTGKMADGVLTSSLEQATCKLFFAIQVLPKNRGAYVDTRFWHGRKHN